MHNRRSMAPSASSAGASAALPHLLLPAPVPLACPRLRRPSRKCPQVADQHGRRYIGIELNPDYLEMSRKRIQLVRDSLTVPMFADA